MNENVGIENLCKEIRSEIKEKGLVVNMLDFDDIPMQRNNMNMQSVGSNEALNYLCLHHNIQAHKPLSGLGVKVFLKKQFAN